MCVCVCVWGGGGGGGGGGGLDALSEQEVFLYNSWRTMLFSLCSVGMSVLH